MSLLFIPTMQDFDLASLVALLDQTPLMYCRCNITFCSASMGITLVLPTLNSVCHFVTIGLTKAMFFWSSSNTTLVFTSLDNFVFIFQLGGHSSLGQLPHTQIQEMKHRDSQVVPPYSVAIYICIPIACWLGESALCSAYDISGWLLDETEG